MGAPLPSRIPWMVLRDWAEVHGITAADFLFLDEVLWGLDTAFIENWKASTNKEHVSTQPSTPDDKIKRWLESE